MPFTMVVIGTGTLAGLCVVGFPLWLLGIPGVEGNYAKGWKQGLTILFLYAFSWLIACAPYYFTRTRLDETTRVYWQQGTAIAVTVLLLLAVVSMTQAFRTMRKADPPRPQN